MVPVTLSAVQPHLARPLTAAEQTRANAWIGAMNVLLTAHYGARVDAHMARTGQDIMPLVHGYVANAVERRLFKKNRMADGEGSGPFTVRWSAQSALYQWFLPEELAELNGALGMTGARTHHTPAPEALIKATSTGYPAPTGGYLGGIPLENYWVDGGNLD